MKVDLETPTMILFLVFLVLKLTGYIGWSWWWITSPLWAGLSLTLLILGIGALFLLRQSRGR